MIRRAGIAFCVLVSSAFSLLAQDAVPVRIRLSCTCPGITAQAADGVLAETLLKRFRVVAGVSKIECESKADGTEVYLSFPEKADTAGSLAAAEAVAKEVRKELPPEATLGKAAVLAKTEALPAIAPRKVVLPVVEIDRERALAYGLTPGEIENTVAKAQAKLKDDPEVAEKLLKVVLRAKEPQIQLRDVATVTMKLVPDRVSRAWP